MGQESPSNHSPAQQSRRQTCLDIGPVLCGAYGNKPEHHFYATKEERDRTRSSYAFYSIRHINIATPEHQLLPEIFAETFRSYYPKLPYAALQIKTGNKSLEFASNRMCRKKQISGIAI